MPEQTTGASVLQDQSAEPGAGVTARNPDVSSKDTDLAPSPPGIVTAKGVRHPTVAGKAAGPGAGAGGGGITTDVVVDKPADEVTVLVNVTGLDV
ncbi:MAG TPA: hypothetical protein PLL54_07675, partial [Dermatophilaceae bacterium]|nr:hypothetical protein [Dermatophilaceae bacterium]